MKQKIGVIRFGGITFILAGVLFGVHNLLLLPLPDPPGTDVELLAWIQEWKFNLAMADEVLIFAALLLIPSIVALFRVLVKVDPVKTWLGCGLLAVTIPVYIMLDIFLGRTIYPVFGLELSADIHRLVLSLYYGGMHAAAIIMCISTVVLSLVIRRSTLGRSVAYLGFLAAAGDLIGSFPWVAGKPLIMVSQVLFSAWFVVVGLKLAVSRAEQTERRSTVEPL
ncbi:hypothetical protein [Paenibacillus tepidiphilus]|uniref:hypothetical protein n=1 Tax=Paenibacillus tepidiphilus TaxID=2608683 RepID=UPI00123BF78F|nr:hypothetical protein [Paenibacillus tepidiphilus]